MKTLEAERIAQEVEIGDWKISSEYGILASPDSKTLVLEPRLSKLMYLLSLNENSIVPRDYLIENIWKDTIVNEESLTRAIADLRKTLKKNFASAFTIDTITKRGYKLVLQVSPKGRVLKLKISKPSHFAMLGLAFTLLLLMLFFL